MTVNNWTEEHLSSLRTLPLKFGVWGKEVGEEGTPHLQVYLIFLEPIRKRTILSTLPCWIHRGLPGNQAMHAGIEYCKKEKNFETIGTLPAQGKRTDLSTCADAIAGGSSMEEVAREFPTQVIRYHQGLRVFQTLLIGPSPPWRQVSVVVLWGPTGSGKTRTALQADSVFQMDSPDGWWDGYLSQTRIVLDEFPREDFPFKYLLRVLDGHPLQLKVKGGFVQAHWTEVYITSNCPPNTWYNADQECYPALERRITEIKHVLP